MAPACSQGEEVQAQAEEGADAIECAIGPGSDFGPDCLIERTTDGDAQVLIVRHANGGFRRFEQLPDGAGIAAYDGADVVEQSLEGDTLVVKVGGDRYRFPTRAKADAAGE
ncbi:MAG: hypothetical protein KJZ64_12980 [Sphingomonadaceae bacterium]|nr:hypothetical protein [Sphingomonadaceae bacterium]